MKAYKFIIAFGLFIAFSNAVFSQKSLPEVVVKYHQDGGGGNSGGGTGGGSGYEPKEPKEPSETVERKGKAKLECVIRPFPACRFEIEGEEKKKSGKVHANEL